MVVAEVPNPGSSISPQGPRKTLLGRETQCGFLIHWSRGKLYNKNVWLMNSGCLNGIGDLKAVVDSLQILPMNQRKDYNDKVNEAQSRLLHQLRKTLYWKLIAHVTPHALWKIHDQRERYLKSRETGGKPLPRCTGSFNKVMQLPCCHDMKGLIEHGGEGATITLNQVHPHRRFVKPPTTRAKPSTTTANQTDAEVMNTKVAEVAGAAETAGDN